MKTQFQLSKTGRNYLNILGLLTYYNEDDEKVYNAYSDSFSNNVDEFQYTDTISINALFKVSSEEEETITDLKNTIDNVETTLQYSISNHLKDENGDTLNDLSLVEFPSDGLYKIRHVVIPTYEWFTENYFATLNEPDPFAGYSNYRWVNVSIGQESYKGKAFYYNDDTDGYVVCGNYTITIASNAFKITGPGLEEETTDIIKDGNTITINTDSISVTITEYKEVSSVFSSYKTNEKNIYVYKDLNIYLIDTSNSLNPKLGTKYDIAALLSSNLDAYDGTIYYEDLYTFTTFQLQECFYKINKSLLNSLCANPCKNSTYEQDIYNRDLVWMGINVIKYLLDLGQFYEAQNTLENLEGCAGICYNSNVVNGGSGCGCNS